MRKTFEIKDKAVLEHLAKQPNQTKYIIGLIRKDMQGQENLTREMVIQIIKEYLGETRNNNSNNNVQLRQSIQNILGLVKE